MENDYIIEQIFNQFTKDKQYLSKNEIINLIKIIQENIICKASCYIIDHYLTELPFNEQTKVIRDFENKMHLINTSLK